MKTRIALALSLGFLLFCLGGLVMNHTGQAQINSMSPYWPIFFGEDPYRMHVLKIESFCVGLKSNIPKKVIVVPMDQKFIVTDVMGYEANTVRLEDQNGTIRWWASGDRGIHLQSGIVFNPGESAFAVCSSTSSGAHAQISGYWVSL